MNRTLAVVVVFLLVLDTGVIFVSLSIPRASQSIAAAAGTGICEPKYQACLKQNPSNPALQKSRCEAEFQKCVLEEQRCKEKNDLGNNNFACNKNADCQIHCTESWKSSDKSGTLVCCKGGAKHKNLCRDEIIDPDGSKECISGPEKGASTSKQRQDGSPPEGLGPSQGGDSGGRGEQPKPSQADMRQRLNELNTLFETTDPMAPPPSEELAAERLRLMAELADTPASNERPKSFFERIGDALGLANPSKQDAASLNPEPREHSDVPDPPNEGPSEYVPPDNTFGEPTIRDTSLCDDGECLTKELPKVDDPVTAEPKSPLEAEELPPQEPVSATPGPGRSICFTDGRACITRVARIPEKALDDPRSWGPTEGIGTIFNDKVCASGVLGCVRSNPDLISAPHLPMGTVANVCGSTGCQLGVVGDFGPNPRFGNRIADMSPSFASRVGNNGLETVVVTPVGYISGANIRANVEAGLGAVGQINAGYPVTLADAVADTATFYRTSAELRREAPSANTYVASTPTNLGTWGRISSLLPVLGSYYMGGPLGKSPFSL